MRFEYPYLIREKEDGDYWLVHVPALVWIAATVAIMALALGA